MDLFLALCVPCVRDISLSLDLLSARGGFNADTVCAAGAVEVPLLTLPSAQGGFVAESMRVVAVTRATIEVSHLALFF